MTWRNGEIGPVGCAVLALIGIALTPILWVATAPPTPGHFTPAQWQATPEVARVAMAKDFAAGDSWRGVPQAQLIAWLGDPGEPETQDSWPLPESAARTIPGRSPNDKRVIDQPRIVRSKSAEGSALFLDRGVAGLSRLPLSRTVVPGGSTSRDAWPPTGARVDGALVAAALRDPPETLTILSWYAGSGGVWHDAAVLCIRLVDDHAVSAWVSFH